MVLKVARVAAIASERNIPYQTEMGGKNVVIVMNDADLDQAAALTAAGAMRYAGQKCTATSRVVVESGVADTFLTKLTDAVAPGVLYSPKGTWLRTSETGQTVNALIDADMKTDIVAGACYNETFVDLRPL